MTQPTVYIVIDRSACAYDENGEILETTEWCGDVPDWTEAGICDERGGGGGEGFRALAAALDQGEKNARLIGYEIVRVNGR